MSRYIFFSDQRTPKFLTKIPSLSIEKQDFLIKNYEGPWIAGGAALKFFQTGSFNGVRDIDIFFKSKKQFDDWSLDFLNLSGTKMLSSAPTYSLFNIVIEYEGFKFNLIAFNFCESPYQTIDDFDFTVCRIFTDGKTIVVDRKALDHIKNKTLSFYKKENLRDKRKIDKRIRKYIGKGFRPDKEMTEWMLANL